MWICAAHQREYASNVLPLPVGADFRYLALQPDTSLHSKTPDKG